MPFPESPRLLFSRLIHFSSRFRSLPHWSRASRSLSRSIESRCERACPFGGIVRGICAIGESISPSSILRIVVLFTVFYREIADRVAVSQLPLDDRAIQVSRSSRRRRTSRSTVVWSFASVYCVGENVYRVKLQERIFRGSRSIFFSTRRDSFHPPILFINVSAWLCSVFICLSQSFFSLYRSTIRSSS